MPAPAADFKVLQNLPATCQTCAVCGRPHALVLISRRATGCSETVVDGNGIATNVAVVHSHHFPPGFTLFLPRVRQIVIATIWAQVDERMSGLKPPIVRLPVVRTKLGASDEERGASIPNSILAPNSSRRSRPMSVLFVMRSVWREALSAWKKQTSPAFAVRFTALHSGPYTKETATENKLTR